MGGIWAEVHLNHMYDEEARGKKSPFWIEDLEPIQLATFDLEQYCEGRRMFSTDEWIDFLIRGLGLEPSFFDRRLKMLLLVRGNVALNDLAASPPARGRAETQ